MTNSGAVICTRLPVADCMMYVKVGGGRWKADGLLRNARPGEHAGLVVYRGSGDAWELVK